MDQRGFMNINAMVWRGFRTTTMLAMDHIGFRNTMNDYESNGGSGTQMIAIRGGSGRHLKTQDAEAGDQTYGAIMRTVDQTSCKRHNTTPTCACHSSRVQYRDQNEDQ